jgi:hypothetical protein
LDRDNGIRKRNSICFVWKRLRGCLGPIPELYMQCELSCKEYEF